MAQGIRNRDAFEENLRELLLEAESNEIDVRGVYDVSADNTVYTIEISQVVEP
jgi:hypothetical protein